MVKNYILTYCSGYEEHVYERFILSLLSTGFKDRLVLFIEEKDISKVQPFVKLFPGVVSYEVCTAQFHPITFRNVAYLNFLLDLNKDEVGDIFLCDTRDILFKLNIFDYPWDKLSRYKDEPSHHLYFFRECGVLGECKINKKWIFDFLTELNVDIKEMNRFILKRICCAGAVFGELSGIILYLRALNTLIALCPSARASKVYGPDQAMHNFIAYTPLLDDIALKEGTTPISVGFLDNKDNLVNHLAWGAPRFTSFLDEDGWIANQDNNRAYCFHLYDRVKDLGKEMSKFPQWSKFNLS